MIACLVIPCFRERAEGRHRYVLDDLDFAGPPKHLLFKILVLVLQKISGALELKMCLDPCQHDRGAYRLSDVIDGAEFEAFSLVLNVRFRCKKDNWNMRGPYDCFQDSAD